MEDNTKEEERTEECVKYSYEDLFFERFKVLLDNCGLTQARLAEEIGTTRQFIWEVAHNKTIPTDAMKVKIAKAMRTDTICIWGKDYGEM